MSRDKLVEEFESKYKKSKKFNFRVGDTIRVDVLVKEGKKERKQAFLGIVIAKKKKGISETFTVYRNAYGSSMERVFLLNSPFISDIKIISKGDVRKGKLYRLRGETGRKARVKEMIGKKMLKKESLEEIKKEPVEEVKKEEESSDKKSSE
jgi:large subunit ribosomal protein L19